MNLTKDFYSKFREVDFKLMYQFEENNEEKLYKILKDAVANYVDAQYQILKKKYPPSKQNNSIGLSISRFSNEEKELKIFDELQEKLLYENLDVDQIVKQENIDRKLVERIQSIRLQQNQYHNRYGTPQKEIGNIEAIRNDEVEKLESALNQIFRQHKSYYDSAKELSKKVLKYANIDDHQEKIDYQINCAKLKKISITNGNYGETIKIVNKIRLSTDFKKDGIEIIKQFDTYDYEGDFFTIFLIKDSHLLKISIATESQNLLERSYIRILDEVKKITIVNECTLKIYIKGFTEPEVLVFDTFEEANQFEENLKIAANMV